MLYPDIEAIRELVESNEILEAVEADIGPLATSRDMTDLPQPTPV